MKPTFTPNSPLAPRLPLFKRAISHVRQRSGAHRAQLLRDFIGGLRRPLRVVDIGGTYSMWQRWGITAADSLHITLVNHYKVDKTHRFPTSPMPFIEERLMDAMTMGPAEFEPYDLVFSNSMLEHLSSREEQAALARVIRSSNKPYFIQVPNKGCIVDPHFPHPAVPFFAMYPKSLRVRLLMLHGFGSSGRAESLAAAQQWMDHYTPLGRKDLETLFPDASVVVERNLGLPMSLVAQRR